jgi:hypothetical protein
MDEKLQAQMEEARAQGYTEEQIKEFLNPQPTARPDMAKDESGAPVSPFVSRGEEAVGTGQYAAAEAAKYAAIGGGGLYGAKKVAQAIRGPVAPSTLPITGSAAHDLEILKSANGSAPSRAPTMMERGTDIAKKMREIAANKVMPAAANAATAAAPYVRGATAVGAMAMPGNAGQNYAAQFPQSGPMRGMEINPATGRPWTPAELQQYNQAY